MEDWSDSCWGWIATGVAAAAYFALAVVLCVVALADVHGGGQACEAELPFVWWCACLTAPILTGIALCLWGLAQCTEDSVMKSAARDDNDDY